ncbi:hypothetical protein CS542_09070 [Pedobacter sp. IW39]|nr:hypothetical protein CS542_09070 [Pedobacter sp. IW39]
MQQAALTPDALQLCLKTRYGLTESWMKLRKLANYLRSKGVKTDMLVPIYLERSAEMVVAILV